MQCHSHPLLVSFGRFLDGDLMLHPTEIAIRKKQNAIPSYTHASSSDVSCKAWRTWWSKYGFSAAPKNTFGPASGENLTLLSRQDMIDPWCSHTRRCSKCQAVLKRSRILRRVGLVVVWGALAFYRQNKVLTVTMSLLGVLSSWGADRLVRELEGAPSKSEVGRRSISMMR
jgi:hypothetical protein